MLPASLNGIKQEIEFFLSMALTIAENFGIAMAKREDCLPLIIVAFSMYVCMVATLC